MEGKIRSNLDVVDDCDSFPYREKDAVGFAAFTQNLYTMIWNRGGTVTPIGYMTEPVFRRLVEVPTAVKGSLEVYRGDRQVSVFQQDSETERSEKVAATTSYWRENKVFDVLGGWRNEMYPVYGPDNQLLYKVERSATPLFGVVTYGVHMTAFVRSPDSTYGMKLWVPRRAAGKQTFAGMLDNTVAGGMGIDEEPLECLIREAEEEASLPGELVRRESTNHGTVTYIYIRTPEATGGCGLIQPECEYVYDLELPPNVIPRPNDDEVQEFYLWTVEEVQEHIAKGEFKPNCAIVLLDFFIRHNILTPENEKDFDEIKSRIHRVLEFPRPHKIDS